MDIRSLPIDLLFNKTLLNSSLNNTSNVTNSSFASLLSELLLSQATNTTSQTYGSNGLFDSLLFLAASLGTGSSSQGLGSPSAGINSSELKEAISSFGAPSTSHGDKSSLQTTNITAGELNSKLKGVLQNTGDQFVAAGKKYQINPALLASVAMHESGNGSSNAAKYKHNIAGMMGKNGLRTYNAVQESIFDMARNLRQNYLDKGKTTISLIGAKYAPIGAANDPTNLNNHWVTGVQKNFNHFTKTTDFA